MATVITRACSSTQGSVMLGHSDRNGPATFPTVKSWNAAGSLTVSADSTFRTADAPVSATARNKHKRSWFESFLNSFF